MCLSWNDSFSSLVGHGVTNQPYLTDTDTDIDMMMMMVVVVVVRSYGVGILMVLA